MNKIYNTYVLSFLTMSDDLIQSLPFFAKDDNTAMDCVGRCGARNYKTCKLWHLGEYNVNAQRFRTYKAKRLVKCWTYNHSKAAEAATPDRKEKRLAKRSK